jgi:hypothetical protein
MPFVRYGHTAGDEMCNLYGYFFRDVELAREGPARHRRLPRAGSGLNQHGLRHLLRALGPRPFTNGIERTVYENALEQVRLADSLGFDTVWAVEHHFLEEYSHCSAPEVFLTAVRDADERIRVGHGAVVCVPR